MINENLYVLLETTDIKKALTDAEQHTLDSLVARVRTYRSRRGESDLTVKSICDAPHHERAGLTGPRSVVIIDDSEQLAELLNVCLNTKEFKVAAIARNSIDGMVASAEHKPDIILLDQHMPGGNGVDAIPFLSLDLPDSVIIMLTTSGNDDLISEAKKRGAAGYIRKPFDPIHIASRIHAIYKRTISARQGK